MSEASRKPAAFDATDPRLELEPLEFAEASAADAPGAGALAVVEPPPQRRRAPWAAMLWSACSGLLLLAVGLAVWSLVEELFARAVWLGALGLALAAIAATALAALAVREIAGLARLRAADAMRHRAAAVIERDDRAQGRALAADVIAQTSRVPRLAAARVRLQGHLGDIIDGRDLVRIAERELMGPLDGEARRLVGAAAKRVSVVTAVSPRAAFDILFVLFNTLALIRRLATLYGGRPGTIGLLKLFRQVLAHLAVTGGVALTDSVIQQVVGHGLAARLSARLGEGMLNGLLTARLGLLAIDLVRPLPFYGLPRPTLNELAGGLLRSAEGEPKPTRAGKTG